VLWKAFAGAIAVIQAFIFALLTVLYFAMAGAGHDEEHEEHEEHAEREESEERGTADEKRQERAPQPA
jgi:F-type H+-transporting ATPase subunit a